MSELIETNLLVSPLTRSLTSENLVVTVDEIFPAGQMTLRGDGGAIFAAAVKSATGLDLPETRRFTVDGNRRLWWMSPDEWLLLCDASEARALEKALEDALTALPHAVINVSDARTLFRVSGDQAATVLQKGSPIDLHPSVFSPGDVRRTHCAEIACAYARTGDSSLTFELIVFRSYSAHICNWLVAAAAVDTMAKL